MIATPKTAQFWQDGWLSTANQLASPNFGVRPADAIVDLIVIHSISLPPGMYGGSKVQQFFTNQLDWEEHPYFQSIRGMAVSTHLYIERDGRLWQFVSCDQRAWHAGVSVFNGRGNCNDFSIGIELEGLEGEHFESAQYLKLAETCHLLQHRYPITQVVGHQHVAPGRKFDPGPGFDWPHFRQALGWPPQCFSSASFLEATKS